MSFRKQFEAWFEANGPEDELSRPNLTKLADGRYFYGFVALAHKSYQAGHAAARAEAEALLREAQYWLGSDGPCDKINDWLKGEKQ